MKIILSKRSRDWSKKLSTAYRTKLTSKDIYVLASLLKKEFGVGVEGLTLVQEIPFQREGIHFVVMLVVAL